MNEQPNFKQAVRDELADWRVWRDRAVVLAYAALAGLAVVGFTALSEWALSRFETMRSWHPWLPLVWMPLVTAGIVWLTRRYEPGAAGSGIPQVMAALDASTPPDQRHLFVSLRMSFAKLTLASGAVAAGLSVGREGPSVQVAAGVMHHARRWLPARSSITDHGLLVAGGAAGIAAAFNTPLAGVVFAIEELSRKIEQRNSGLIITAIVLAGLVAVSAFGNSNYFGVIRVGKLDFGLLWPAFLVVISAGLLGGLFARLLVASLAGTPDRFSRYRRDHPIRFAFYCGLAVAVIGVACGGMTFGGGYEQTKGLLDGHDPLPAVYVLLKFVSTWLSTWSGVPGGIFAPSLAIGAGLGSDIASLTGSPFGTALIALGMCGFLAAVTQAPITSFIIVMEMVDGHAMVLSLMASALGSSLVSRLLCRPLYGELAAMQLRRLPPPPALPGKPTDTPAAPPLVPPASSPDGTPDRPA
jgi:H+/Cl- antiporter ClcA